MIRKSIRILYERLTPARVAEFTEDLPIYTLRGSSESDLIVDIQTLAGVIVEHYLLPPGTAIVGFRDLSVPGRVELGRDNSYLIELSSEYRRNVQDIGGVLAHEVAHIFLYRHGIALDNTFANEVLTDTTAVFLRALEILNEDPTLAHDQDTLWRFVTDGRTIRHNGQMDVVCTLFRADLLTDGEA